MCRQPFKESCQISTNKIRATRLNIKPVIVTVTRQRVTCLWCVSCAEAKIFFSLNIQTRTGAHQASNSVCTGDKWKYTWSWPLIIV